jgi:hypothetical protein
MTYIAAWSKGFKPNPSVEVEIKFVYAAWENTKHGRIRIGSRLERRNQGWLGRGHVQPCSTLYRFENRPIPRFPGRREQTSLYTSSESTITLFILSKGLVYAAQFEVQNQEIYRRRKTSCLTTI